MILCFFLIGTATTAIYTYCHTRSLHDALPIDVSFLLGFDLIADEIRARFEIALDILRRAGPEGLWVHLRHDLVVDDFVPVHRVLRLVDDGRFTSRCDQKRSEEHTSDSSH